MRRHWVRLGALAIWRLPCNPGTSGGTNGGVGASGTNDGAGTGGGTKGGAGTSGAGAGGSGTAGSGTAGSGEGGSAGRPVRLALPVWVGRAALQASAARRGQAGPGARPVGGRGWWRAGPELRGFQIVRIACALRRPRGTTPCARRLRLRLATRIVPPVVRILDERCGLPAPFGSCASLDS